MDFYRIQFSIEMVTAAWDPGTSKAIVAFPNNTVEIAILVENPRRSSLHHNGPMAHAQPAEGVWTLFATSSEVMLQKGKAAAGQEATVLFP